MSRELERKLDEIMNNYQPNIEKAIYISNINGLKRH
jgi:hypothetical protein